MPAPRIEKRRRASVKTKAGKTPSQYPIMNLQGSRRIKTEGNAWKDLEKQAAEEAPPTWYQDWNVRETSEFDAILNKAARLLLTENPRAFQGKDYKTFSEFKSRHLLDPRARAQFLYSVGEKYKMPAISNAAAVIWSNPAETDFDPEVDPYRYTTPAASAVDIAGNVATLLPGGGAARAALQYGPDVLAASAEGASGALPSVLTRPSIAQDLSKMDKALDIAQAKLDLKVIPGHQINARGEARRRLATSLGQYKQLFTETQVPAQVERAKRHQFDKALQTGALNASMLLNYARAPGAMAAIGAVGAPAITGLGQLYQDPTDPAAAVAAAAKVAPEAAARAASGYAAGKVLREGMKPSGFLSTPLKRVPSALLEASSNVAKSGLTKANQLYNASMGVLSKLGIVNKLSPLAQYAARSSQQFQRGAQTAAGVAETAAAKGSRLGRGLSSVGKGLKRLPVAAALYNIGKSTVDVGGLATGGTQESLDKSLEDYYLSQYGAGQGEQFLGHMAALGSAAFLGDVEGLRTRITAVGLDRAAPYFKQQIMRPVAKAKAIAEETAKSFAELDKLFPGADPQLVGDFAQGVAVNRVETRMGDYKGAARRVPEWEHDVIQQLPPQFQNQVKVLGRLDPEATAKWLLQKGPEGQYTLNPQLFGPMEKGIQQGAQLDYGYGATQVDWVEPEYQAAAKERSERQVVETAGKREQEATQAETAEQQAVQQRKATEQQNLAQQQKLEKGEQEFETLVQQEKQDYLQNLEAERKIRETTREQFASRLRRSLDGQVVPKQTPATRQLAQLDLPSAPTPAVTSTPAPTAAPGVAAVKSNTNFNSWLDSQLSTGVKS